MRSAGYMVYVFGILFVLPMKWLIEMGIEDGDPVGAKRLNQVTSKAEVPATRDVISGG